MEVRWQGGVDIFYIQPGAAVAAVNSFTLGSIRSMRSAGCCQASSSAALKTLAGAHGGLWRGRVSSVPFWRAAQSTWLQIRSTNKINEWRQAISICRNKNGHRNWLCFTLTAWKRTLTDKHVVRGELSVLSYRKKMHFVLSRSISAQLPVRHSFLIFCCDGKPARSTNLHWAKQPGSKK